MKIYIILFDIHGKKQRILNAKLQKNNCKIKKLDKKINDFKKLHARCS